jgi:hypothetical protein
MMLVVDEIVGVTWMQSATTAWDRLTALGKQDMHVHGDIRDFFMRCTSMTDDEFTSMASTSLTKHPLIMIVPKRRS